jgi:predicted TIM-barrel fold metal-dependent hydrolase
MSRPRILGFVAFGLAAAAIVAVLLAIRAPVGPGAGGGSDGSAPRVGGARRRIDAHTHLMVGALPQLVELMDRYGFEHVVDLSGGTPETSLGAHVAQANASGGRITVYMTMPGREFLAPGYGPRIASMLERAKAMGARGLKISKGLGLGFEGSDGKLIPVDDPGLDVVFETCGRIGFPVTIHTADPKAFWQPPDRSNERFEELRVHPGWSFYGQPVAPWADLLDQLERRIARHPRTTFVAVHFGNAAEEPDRVARMLRKYPNMYIDTAARVPEFGRHAADRMRAFFIEFQDRILYGTDLGVGIDPLDVVTGSSGAEPPTWADIDRFFDSSYRYFETRQAEIPSPTPIQGTWNVHGIGLPAEVLDKIYGRNARRVMGIGAGG